MSCPFKYLLEKSIAEGLERRPHSERVPPRMEEYLEMLLPIEDLQKVFKSGNFTINTKNKEIQIQTLQSFIEEIVKKINASIINIIENNYNREEYRKNKNIYLKDAFIRNFNIGITMIYRIQLVCLYLLYGYSIDINTFDKKKFLSIGKKGEKFINEIAVSSGEDEIAGKLEDALGLLPINHEPQYSLFFLNKNNIIEFNMPSTSSPRYGTNNPYYYGCPAFYTKHIRLIYEQFLKIFCSIKVSPPLS